MRAFFTLAFVMFFAFPTYAHGDGVGQCGTGGHGLPEGYVNISLSATERIEVEQDLLIGTLSYSVTNANSKDLQDEINKAMAKALDKAKKVESVKVNTGSYQVYETTDPHSKMKQWHGQQSLTLKSKDADDLLGLAGELQELGLDMNGLSYALSPEAAASIQDGLMEDALRQLQTRADRAASALNKSAAELTNIMVNNNDRASQKPRYSRTEMRSMTATDSASAPVAAAGETTITLSVRASAILRP